MFFCPPPPISSSLPLAYKTSAFRGFRPVDVMRLRCTTKDEARRLAANIAKLLPDLLISKTGVVEQDTANDRHVLKRRRWI
jgi:hypothetical protein